MLIWDKANIPHKGWEYIGIEDLGEDKCSGEPITYERCEMCGNDRLSIQVQHNYEKNFLSTSKGVK